jgi:hypothetical protein
MVPRSRGLIPGKRREEESVSPSPPPQRSTTKEINALTQKKQSIGVKQMLQVLKRRAADTQKERLKFESGGYTCSPGVLIKRSRTATMIKRLVESAQAKLSTVQYFSGCADSLDSSFCVKVCSVYSG